MLWAMTTAARAASFCALLLSACQAPAPAREAPPWPESGVGPTPYSAEEIRAAHPDGTELCWQMTQNGERGPDQWMQFSEGDEHGVTVWQWSERAGDVIGAPAEQYSTWAELRDHARFDAEMTTREAATAKVAAGTFACWLYTVREVARPGVVQQYYFAHARPGPPVLYVLTSDGEEELRMELVQDRSSGERSPRRW
jgi:hypothetical protein